MGLEFFDVADGRVAGFDVDPPVGVIVGAVEYLELIVDGLAEEFGAEIVELAVVLTINLPRHVQAHSEVDGRGFGLDLETNAVGGVGCAIPKGEFVVVGKAGGGCAHDLLSISIVFHFQRQVLHWRVRQRVYLRGTGRRAQRVRTTLDLPLQREQVTILSSRNLPRPIYPCCV